jgi:hypothetical protein
MYPTLTRTNNGELDLLMRVIPQASGVVDEGGVGANMCNKDGYHNDRVAMESILRVVPPEMVPTLGAKDTSKEA